MPDWLVTILVPALAGIFAFIGGIAGVRTDIAWIKRTLARHEAELGKLHSRISRTLSGGP